MFRLGEWGFVWLLGLSMVLSATARGQEMYYPLPEPRPAPLPSSGVLPQNPMLDLTRSHDFSVGRVSSHCRRGGPRDNWYIPTTGEEVTIADIKGPGAITHIWTTHRWTGHELIVRIYGKFRGHHT